MNLADVRNPKELGEYLKYTRLSKNISLEEINKETKIRVKYLVAIEEGNFESIPGGEVYIKGFLKNYAEAVGLDSNEVLKKYKEISAPIVEESIVEESKSQQNISDEKANQYIFDEKKSKFMPIKTSFLLVACVVVIAVIIISSSLKAPTETTELPKQPANTDITLETEEDLTSETESELTSKEEEDNRQDNVNVIHLVEDDGKNITYSVDADSLKVKFEVIKDRCWVSVKEGNSVIFQGNLNSGETKEWETTDKLRIRIGNPPAVKVILNGNEIDISGDHPKNLIVMRKQ